MRRLALVLLLLIPGAIVVRAGVRDTGVRDLSAEYSDGYVPPLPGLNYPGRYLLRTGDLTGRIWEALDLETGDPPLTTLDAIWAYD